MIEVHAQRIADAVETLIGSPFRLHGRDPQTGLDCVGLVLSALAAGGISPPRVPAYRLKQAAPPDIDSLARQVGLRPASGKAQPGDLLAFAPGPAQTHLGIKVRRGLVHAHAALGRVCLTPEPLPWPLTGHWRADFQGL